MRLAIKKGVATHLIADEAVKFLYQQIVQDNMKWVIFFCSPDYDLDALAVAFNDYFPDIEVIGCTTAGEITPLGYLHGSLTGVSFAGSDFDVVVSCFKELNYDKVSNMTRAMIELKHEMLEKNVDAQKKDMFSFLLVDGLSLLEEVLVSSLYYNLDGIPLVGGSAADGLNLKQTFLFHRGQFHSNCAIVALVHTTQPFKLFKTEHFLNSDKKMVITDADCKKRVVTEINGEVAGKEYARLIGVKMADLDSSLFAQYPLVLKMRNEHFVRSIHSLNEDGSLNFASAIDIGLVLSLAKGVDILENLQQSFDEVIVEIGKPSLILGCDCIFRHLELDQRNIKARAGEIMVENNVIGFSTYGEQFNAMHMNQTFTGIAIGESTSL